MVTLEGKIIGKWLDHKDFVLLSVVSENQLDPSIMCEYSKKASYLNQDMTLVRY